MVNVCLFIACGPILFLQNYMVLAEKTASGFDIDSDDDDTITAGKIVAGREHENFEEAPLADQIVLKTVAFRQGRKQVKGTFKNEKDEPTRNYILALTRTSLRDILDLIDEYIDEQGLHKKDLKFLDVVDSRGYKVRVPVNNDIPVHEYILQETDYYIQGEDGKPVSENSNGNLKDETKTGESLNKEEL